MLGPPPDLAAATRRCNRDRAGWPAPAAGLPGRAPGSARRTLAAAARRSSRREWHDGSSTRTDGGRLPGGTPSSVTAGPAGCQSHAGHRPAERRAPAAPVLPAPVTSDQWLLAAEAPAATP